MVTVESIKPISNAGNLRGFATISVAGKIRISDVRIIRQDGQTAWVSMPSRAYEKDGARKWAPIVELLDDQLKTEISEAVLTEFDKVSASAPTKQAPTGW